MVSLVIPWNRSAIQPISLTCRPKTGTFGPTSRRFRPTCKNPGGPLFANWLSDQAQAASPRKALRMETAILKNLKT